MKIKIIKSPSLSLYQGYEYLPPLAIASLSAYLKNKGFDIVQQDLNVAPGHKHAKRQLERIRGVYFRLFLDRQRLLKYLGGEDDKLFDKIVNRYITSAAFEGVDLLLISVYCADFYSSILALLFARFFKSSHHNKLAIVGGEWLQCSHIYDNFELYNKTGAIDYYIAGYGEEPLYKLLQKIQGAEIDFRDIPGLCYRENDKVYRPTHFADQVLTMPDFDDLNLTSYQWKQPALFRKISKQKLPDIGVLMLPVRMIYGCPNRCAFCASCAYKKLYYLDPKEAVGNLARLSRRYNTPYFFFLDDEVNVSEKFILSFCEEILGTGLKIYWSACASFKQINNPDTLMKMRKAGACRLIFGLETASPRLLHYINKDIELAHVSRVLRWSHEAGIWTGLEIIAGMPYENMEDANMSVDFISTHRQHLDEVWLNRFYLAVGSDMFSFPQEYGIKNISQSYGHQQVLKRDTENYVYSYDETGGLSWEGKQQQMEEACSIINKTINDCGLNTRYDIREELNVLFYLYTFLSDKRKIKDYLKQYCDLKAEA